MTDKIKEKIASIHEYSELRKKLANIKNLDYKVNDYLVREKKPYGMNKTPTLERRDDQLNTPKRWRVVDVDEYGIPCLQFVRLKGGPGAIVYLGDEETYYGKFALDPEYMDYVLMGCPEDYDPLVVYKEKTKALNALKRKNKKLSFHNKRVEVEAFFNTLDVGDKFWYTSYLSTSIDNDSNEYVFEGIVNEHHNKFGKPPKQGVTIKGKNSYYRGYFHSFDVLSGGYVFKDKPICMEYDRL